MNRRKFLTTTAGAGAALGIGLFAGRGAAKGETFEIMKTEEEWRKLLSPAQYRVLREEDTERPGTSPLLAEKRKGIFHCAGCDNPLFESDKKYESGTGWPSFWQEIAGKVGYKEDRSWLGILRIEEHCARCGGHLGHVFDDGPQPTGKRHCINGVALNFRPATA